MKSPQNPTSFKSRLASRFLRAMKRLKNNTPPSPSAADKYKRCHAIRAAAYASMASVVGRNKAWSRAVLRKIKSRELQRIMKERKSSLHHGRRHPAARNPRLGDLVSGPETDLRELLPGGEALDFGRLLSESSDYIKCLKAQVEVMRKIVEYSSSLRF